MLSALVSMLSLSHKFSFAKLRNPINSTILLTVSTSAPSNLPVFSAAVRRRFFYLRPFLTAADGRNSFESRSLDGFSATKESVLEDGKPPPSTGPVDSDGMLKIAQKKKGEDYPSGEFEMVEFGWWKNFTVKLRMLLALPWERVPKGSVLTMKIRGQISDQLTSRFTSGLSLPQICENFIKAAYDPRISGMYLHIEPLSCGWGKIDEIRRHILSFKKSGKFVVSYVPICAEKEYYLACACGEVYIPPSAYVTLFGLSVQATFLRGVLDKVGIEPQIQQIGKYKSVGDLLAARSMPKEVCEMLTSLLDNIYDNWVETIASSQGKAKEEIDNFINSGVYQVGRLKEVGWITNILYDDEVISMLKERLGQQQKKKLLMVDYRKYSRVRKWTIGLGGGGDRIAIIRAKGLITRTRSPLSNPSSGIIAEQLIEKIRSVKESDKYKAVVLRIDSLGGDALAADLLWREIRLLSASKPVIASMADVATSAAYYSVMGADAIVSEKLTLTGSIGVVLGKFSLQKLYERIGFNKEVLSRGKFAELNTAEQRPLRPDEEELFAKSAQNIYKLFRDKAAFSRSMSVDQMEEVAQGRVWSGKDAASLGLVDAVGGFDRAVAIARQKANIPQDRQVRLVEVTKPSPSLPQLLSSIGSSIFSLDKTVKEVVQEMSSSAGVQARMDGIVSESLGDAFDDHHLVLKLIRDCLRSFN